MTASDIPALTVDVLGRLEVSRAGRPVAIGSPRQRALLSLLVIRPDRFASTGWLVDALWDGAPPPGAETTLRSHVAGLRRIIEPDRGTPGLLRHRDGGYHLDIAADALDLVRFESLLDLAATAYGSGDAATAERHYSGALRLWRGDPLPDLGGLAAGHTEIARLHGLRSQAEEGRLAAAVDTGAHVRVLPELQAFVAAHPLRETARAQLMLALYRCGRQAEALALFSEAHRLLTGEYGLDPGARLRAVHRGILDQDPALDLPGRQRAGEGGTDSAPQPLPGRAPALAQLTAARAAALTGSGRIALLAGDPGVGKTTLAARVAADAERDGVPVVWARCPAVGQAPPFWMWTQLVRRLSAAVPDRHADALAVLGVHTPAPAAAADAAARFRLYEAVAELTAEAARERGLVLILDDLHAADPDSLLLLRFLAGAPAPARVLLVATTRPYQHDPGLVAAVAELARTPGFTRADLSGLDEPALAELMRAQLGADPDPAAVATLRHRTGGNPFFAVELLRHGGSADLPPTVRDALSLRLDTVPTATRACLDVLAVAGHELDLGLLARVLDLPVAAVTEALVPAFAGRLVAEEGPGRVDFGHPLLAEVGYAVLAPPRRSRLHARLASVYEAAGGAAPAEVAFHFGRAAGLGHEEDHLHWLLRAADDATRRLAYEDALAHLDQAAERLSARGDAAQELAVQLQRAALLQVTVGIGSDAVDGACVRARELLELVGPGSDLSSARWVLGELAANRAEYDICLELAAPLVDAVGELTRAAGCYLGGAAYYFLGRLEEAQRWLTESARLLSGMDVRELRREVPRRPALAPYHFRALVRSLRGDQVGAQEDLAEAAALAERIDDPYGRANAALYAAWLGLQELDAAAGNAAAERFRRLGLAHGMPHFVTTAELFAAWAAVSAGATADRDRLRRAYEAIYRPGLRATRTITLGAMAAAHLTVGDRAGAADLAEEGLTLSARTGELVFRAELLRLRALATGDPRLLPEAAALATEQGAHLLLDRITRTAAAMG